MDNNAQRSKRYRTPEINIPAVILNVSDGGPNFKEMAIATRDEMRRDITGSYGESRDSLVLAGGVLSV